MPLTDKSLPQLTKPQTENSDVGSEPIPEVLNLCCVRSQKDFRRTADKVRFASRRCLRPFRQHAEYSKL